MELSGRSATDRTPMTGSPARPLAADPPPKGAAQLWPDVFKFLEVRGWYRGEEQA